MTTQTYPPRPEGNPLRSKGSIADQTLRETDGFHKPWS